MTGLIPNSEIDATFETDPTRGILMVMANVTTKQVEQMAAGEIAHTPKEHEMGWSMSLRTQNGVGAVLSFNWLGSQLFIGYPKSSSSLLDCYTHQAIASEICTVCAVEFSREVLHVSGTAVSTLDYSGEYKDEDKPLEITPHNQLVAYHTRGMRSWGSHYGPILPEGGRVWIEHSNFNSLSFHVPNIHKGELTVASYGHDYGNCVSTYPYSFYNKYSPENPNARSENIRPYRDKFINLLLSIARYKGTVESVTITYGLVFVPEQMEKLGYTLTNIRANNGFFSDGRSDHYYTKEGVDEVIVLQPGNSIVPWNTIRQVKLKADATAEDLIALLTF